MYFTDDCDVIYSLSIDITGLDPALLPLRQPCSYEADGDLQVVHVLSDFSQVIGLYKAARPPASRQIVID